MRNTIPVLLLLTLGPIVSAQSVAPSSNANPTTAVNDPAIELKPFVVSAGADDGYAPTETLSGTRLKTQAKDVARPTLRRCQVSVENTLNAFADDWDAGALITNPSATPGAIEKAALARREGHSRFGSEIGSPTRAVIPESPNATFSLYHSFPVIPFRYTTRPQLPRKP